MVEHIEASIPLRRASRSKVTNKVIVSRSGPDADLDAFVNSIRRIDYGTESNSSIQSTNRSHGPAFNASGYDSTRPRPLDSRGPSTSLHAPLDSMSRLGGTIDTRPLVIKEGLLQKWNGYHKLVNLSNPWTIRKVVLKPGIVLIGRADGTNLIIPVSDPDTIISDKYKFTWTVKSSVGPQDTIILKLEKPDMQEFLIWEEAFRNARDHYRDIRRDLEGHPKGSSIGIASPRVGGHEASRGKRQDSRYAAMGSEEAIKPLEQIGERLKRLKHQVNQGRTSTYQILKLLRESIGDGSRVENGRRNLETQEVTRLHLGALANFNNFQVQHDRTQATLTEIDELYGQLYENHKGLERGMTKALKESVHWRGAYDVQMKLCNDFHSHIASTSPQSQVLASTDLLGMPQQNLIDSGTLPSGAPTPHLAPSARLVQDSDEFSVFESAESESDAESGDLGNASEVLARMKLPAIPASKPGPIVRRVVLPMPRTEFKTSLWTTLKECVGRDLSRVALPVTFNEPTSFLQRAAEDFMYNRLLDNACSRQGPLKSFPASPAAISAVYVAAFLISPYSSALGRTFKPFNPLLGETYEIRHRGFDYLAEQVSHHPPGMAYHAQGGSSFPGSPEEWAVWGNLSVNMHFTGKSLTIQMKGEFKLEVGVNEDATATTSATTSSSSQDAPSLNCMSSGSIAPKKDKRANKKQTWSATRPLMSIDNIIFGKLTIDLYGQAIAVADDGYCIIIEYIRSGWWSSIEHQVKGVVYDASPGAKCVPELLICGTWSSALYVEKVIKYSGSKLPLITPELVKGARRGHQIIPVHFDTIETDPSTRVLVWQCESRPKHSSEYYEFSKMTYELNEITPEYDKNQNAMMPSTDSRFRPDQRLLEMGLAQESNEVKRLLEEKQRAAARARLDGEASYQPLWFAKTQDIDAMSGEPRYTFRHNYWDVKKTETQDYYRKCPDIYLSPEEVKQATEDYAGSSRE